MKKTLILSILAAFSLFLSGCISNGVSITTAHAWEKRYSTQDEIVINGQKIDMTKGDVWVLGSKTLYNLLTIEGHKVIDLRK